jgi:hypothetical protein
MTEAFLGLKPGTLSEKPRDDEDEDGGEAYDSACPEFHDTGQPAIVYEVIAKRIIDAAKAGERDLVRLRNTDLSALGFNSDDKEAS